MIRLLDRLMGGPLRLLRLRRPRAVCEDPRILVIRRNRMGDMLCTLPLLRALRARFPAARIVVACDAEGEPIARACSAVNEIIPLRRGTKLWLAPWRYLFRWQQFDWVIAAKAGFDSRLARLARLTHAARRIGYEDTTRSEYYTDPVPIPADILLLHQIEATLGLLAPLDVAPPLDLTRALKLDLPVSARTFAGRLAPFWQDRALVLVNVSSAERASFREEDWTSLVKGLAAPDGIAVGLVGLPSDLERAERLAGATGGRARVLATPSPLELAALMGQARVVVTAEGGAAHLAAAVGAPAVVLWSEAPFQKWMSRGPGHVFLRRGPREDHISLDAVRAAIAPYLASDLSTKE